MTCNANDYIIFIMLVCAGSGSGGFSDHVFRRSALEVWSQETGQINYKTVKNNDFQEIIKSDFNCDGKATQSRI